jgi:hypothetical protein
MRVAKPYLCMIREQFLVRPGVSDYASGELKSSHRICSWEAMSSTTQLEFAVGKGVSGKIKGLTNADLSAPPLDQLQSPPAELRLRPAGVR